MTGVCAGMLALLVAITAGCRSGTGIPPPTELADRGKGVHEQVAANASLFSKGDASRHIAALDVKPCPKD